MHLVLRRPDDPTFEAPLGEAPLALGSGPNVDVLVTGEGIENAHARISVREIEAIADLDVGGVRLRAGARRVCVPSRLQIGTVALTIERAGAALSSIATKELALCAVDTPSLLWPIVLVVEGPARGRELVLQQDGTHRVGRDPHAALMIDDAKMSREHFEIVVTRGEVSVRDLGSTGGLWLGSARLDRGRKARWPSHRMLLAGRSVFALLVPETLAEGPVVQGGEGEGEGEGSMAELAPTPSAPVATPPAEDDPLDEDAGAAGVVERRIEVGGSSPISLVVGRDAASAAPAVRDVRLRAVVVLFAATCVVVIGFLGYLLFS